MKAIARVAAAGCVAVKRFKAVGRVFRTFAIAIECLKTGGCVGFPDGVAIERKSTNCGAVIDGVLNSAFEPTAVMLLPVVLLKSAL
jgi:hypothetical protein